jgi:hypothetical protein
VARAENDCPRLGEVVAGLKQVLTTEQAEDAANQIVIRDEGENWSIEVRGHTSLYWDPGRNCTERARVAAVFAALALEPVDTEEAPPPVRVEEAPHPRRFSLEAGPQVVLATRAQARNTPVGGGGQVRVIRSGERLGVALGVEAARFSELDLGGYGASMARAACDLSGRILLFPGGVTVAGELGPSFVLLRVRGTGLATSPSANRFDVGARAALLARLRTRWAPFVSVQAEVGTRRFDLAVHPSGSIGLAPRLWLGLAVGGAFDL